MERERLGSRLGFIFLSAGCAIGCGNVWKFPWMTGKNGGGAFVVVYILCLLLLGLPAMVVEFSIGRASQASPVKMYQKLEKPGQKWHWHGILAMLGNFCLMAFYTVVTGWILYYFVSFLIGQTADLGFVTMITNAKVNVGYLVAVVVIAFILLSFNIQSGLERVTKYMMAALLCLMLVLAVRSFTLSGAAEGLRFYLLPDFGKINFNVVVAAMNQAFFTLSIGIGSMAIFGSYIGKEHSLMGESVNVIVLDTFVAIMSGLIIFPACT
ncbi:MAG: sodium-dependent transporter, partial [Lachnospiraceae bacterium]|nr:sodium-dependent transporter [Lachnospiraceae bacterium]